MPGDDLTISDVDMITINPSEINPLDIEAMLDDTSEINYSSKGPSYNKYTKLDDKTACRVFFVGGTKKNPAHCFLLINDTAKTAVDFPYNTVTTHSNVNWETVQEFFDIPKGADGKGVDPEKMAQFARQMDGFIKFKEAIKSAVHSTFYETFPDLLDLKNPVEKNDLIERIAERAQKLPDAKKQKLQQRFITMFGEFRARNQKDQHLYGQRIFAPEGLKKTAINYVFNNKKLNFPITRFDYNLYRFNCCKVPAMILSAGGVQSILAKASLINTTIFAPIHFIRYLRKVKAKLEQSTAGAPQKQPNPKNQAVKKRISASFKEKLKTYLQSVWRYLKKEKGSIIGVHTENGAIVFNKNYQYSSQNLDIQFLISHKSISNSGDMPKLLNTISSVMNKFNNVKWVVCSPEFSKQLPVLTISPKNVASGEKIMMAIENALVNSGYKAGKGHKGHIQIGEFAWHKPANKKNPYPYFAPYVSPNSKNDTKVTNLIEQAIKNSDPNDDMIKVTKIPQDGNKQNVQSTSYTADSDTVWEDFLSSEQDNSSSQNSKQKSSKVRSFVNQATATAKKYKHSAHTVVGTGSAFASGIIAERVTRELFAAPGSQDKMSKAAVVDTGILVGMLHGLYVETGLTVRAYTGSGILQNVFPRIHTTLIHIPLQTIFNQIKNTFHYILGLGVGLKFTFQTISHAIMIYLAKLKNFALCVGGKLNAIIKWTRNGLFIIKSGVTAGFTALASSGLPLLLKCLISAVAGYIAGSIARWIMDGIADSKNVLVKYTIGIPAKAARISLEYPWTFLYSTPAPGYVWDADMSTGHMETVPDPKLQKERERKINQIIDYNIVKRRTNNHSLNLGLQRKEFNGYISKLEKGIQIKRKQIKELKKNNLSYHVFKEQIYLGMNIVLSQRLSLINKLAILMKTTQKVLSRSHQQKMKQKIKPYLKIQKWGKHSLAMSTMNEFIYLTKHHIQRGHKYIKTEHFKKRSISKKKLIKDTVSSIEKQIIEIQSELKSYDKQYLSVKKSAQSIRSGKRLSLKWLSKQYNIDFIYQRLSFSKIKNALCILHSKASELKDKVANSQRVRKNNKIKLQKIHDNLKTDLLILEQMKSKLLIIQESVKKHSQLLRSELKKKSI